MNVHGWKFDVKGMMQSGQSNIVLIGMPGAGKSTVGVLLAKRLGLSFLDTDVLIQAACGKSLRDLIDERGMAGFCQIERDYVRGIQVAHTVIATGGSVVYYDDAMQRLQAGGRVVYLQLPLEELRRRVDDLNARGVVLEPGQTLESLYEKRRPLYERWAQVTVPLCGLNHEQAVETIIKTLQG